MSAKKKSVAAEPRFEVAESISGTYFYHVRDANSTTDAYRALCGARVMTTSIPMSDWGVVTHLHDRWCKQCREAYLSATQAGQEMTSSR